MCSLSKSKINTRLVSLAVSYLSAALLRKSSSSCDGTIKQINEQPVFFRSKNTRLVFFCLNIPWSRDDFSARCLFRFPPPSPEVWTSGAPVTNWVSLPAPESVSPQSASGGVELQPPIRCTHRADSQDGSRSCRPQAPESFIIPNWAMDKSWYYP